MCRGTFEGSPAWRSAVNDNSNDVAAQCLLEPISQYNQYLLIPLRRSLTARELIYLEADNGDLVHGTHDYSALIENFLSDFLPRIMQSGEDLRPVVSISSPRHTGGNGPSFEYPPVGVHQKRGRSYWDHRVPGNQLLITRFVRFSYQAN